MKPKPPVPLWRWALWWGFIGLALVVFYVLLDADLVGTERPCLAGGVPRPAPALTQQAGFEHSFAGGLDPIRGGAFA